MTPSNYTSFSKDHCSVGCRMGWRKVAWVPGWGDSLCTCSSCKVSQVSSPSGSLDEKERAGEGRGPSGEGERPTTYREWQCYPCLDGEGPAGRHCETEVHSKPTAQMFCFHFSLGGDRCVFFQMCSAKVGLKVSDLTRL